MNRTIHALLFLWLSTSWLMAQSGPYCIQGRFAEEPYFAANEILEIKDVTYGQAMRWPSTAVDTLKMDIYMPDPAIDPLVERPFVLFIHGGAFIGGQREDMTSICQDFARRGYVAATMSYRLGWNCDPNAGLLICFYCGPQADKLRVAAYRAVQDTRAALRFVAANAAQYGIDANSFFVGGTSAGSVAAIHAAFLDQEQADIFCPDCVPAVGKLDSGVNTIYADYAIQGVLNNCGAVMNMDIFTAGLPMPMISFHDDGDCVVPAGYGYALGCLNCQEFFLAHGSKEMQTASGQNDNCFEMNLRLNSLNHCSYPQSTIVSRSSCFLKNILCGTCESMSSNDLYHAGSCMSLGTTAMFDPERERLDVRIYPNPSDGQSWISLGGLEGDGPVRVKVINALGMSIADLAMQSTPGQPMELPRLAPGMYVVLVQGQGTWSVPRKLMVE